MFHCKTESMIWILIYACKRSIILIESYRDNPIKEFFIRRSTKSLNWFAFLVKRDTLKTWFTERSILEFFHDLLLQFPCKCACLNHVELNAIIKRYIQLIYKNYTIGNIHTQHDYKVKWNPTALQKWKTRVANSSGTQSSHLGKFYCLYFLDFSPAREGVCLFVLRRILNFCPEKDRLFFFFHV